MDTKIISLPNLLTISRVIAIPFIIFLYLEHEFFWATVAISISFLTDFLDGWVARKLGQSSDLGALLDPIADKTVALAYALFLGVIMGALPWWYAGIAAFRNFSQLMCIPVLSWWLNRKFYARPKLFPKIGTALGFIVLAVAPLGDMSEALQPILMFGFIVSGIFELEILRTYLPRLVAIARGKHDTFE